MRFSVVVTGQIIACRTGGCDLELRRIELSPQSITTLILESVRLFLFEFRKRVSGLILKAELGI
jgi:hypothetical protein